MDRRQLLCTLAAVPAAGLARRLQAASPAGATTSTRLASAPEAGAKFLLVFLRGGLDTAHLLVPYGSDFYYRVRPSIAIARPGSGAGAVSPLDGYWGLHPALADTVLPIYQRGEAAFVAFAGTEDTSRSHFETQDSIELGQPLAGHRDYGSGFLDRLAVRLGATQPIAFTEQLPLALRGPRPVANIALRSLGRAAVDARQSALIAAMYAGTPLETAVSTGFGTRDEVAHELADEMDASRGAPTAKGFEAEARRVGRLMQERYDLGFIDVGGWDTHVNQGNDKGYLAQRLGELGAGLAAFASAMGPRWRDTVVVVLSEFGRTLRENGNHGTDHGHGTVYWVLGGAVRGGRIAGEQQAVEEPTLFQNRDYPVLNDYRAVLGGLFRVLYGLDQGVLAEVFPGATPVDLRLA